MKEQFRVRDSMDPKDLDYRAIHACSYKAMPHPSGTRWSKVVHRLARPASSQSVPFSDATDMDQGCWIAHALCDHVG